MDLKTLRTRRGLTQEALARRAGITKPYVSQLEHRVRTPSLAVLRRLAKALGVAPAALLTVTVKTRRACVVGALGWYLLTPPVAEHEGKPQVQSAPLLMWEQVEAYDTARKCEDGKSERLKMVMDHLLGRPDDDLSKHLVRSFVAFQNARCVASDDPRLKR